MCARRAIATGIQLAERAVHGVCLAREHGAVGLVGVASVPVDCDLDPVRLGGARGQAALVQALAAVRSRLGVKTGAVGVGLAHGSYVLRMSALLHPRPRGRRQARSNAAHLRWEIEQVLGDEASRYACASTIVGAQGMVVAARRGVLELHARTFGRAGLGQPRFDVEAVALHNIAEAAGVLGSAPLAVVVGCSARGADVLVARNGVLQRIAHCRLENGEAPVLAACVREQCGRAVAVGTVTDPAEGAVWVAGPRASAVCAALGDELGCAVAPLPWHGMLRHAEEPENAVLLAIAAGLAVRRLDP